MFISDEYRLIVMLPQKCASKTIQMRLDSLRSPDSLDSAVSYHEGVQKFIGKHVTLKTAFELRAFDSREGYYKVCFVRNPYDRVYSWFNWIRRSLGKSVPELTGEGRELERLLHIKRSRERMIKRMEAASYDFNLYLQANEKLFRPAYKFTHFGRKCYMDFVGHQESFERDYDQMIKMFNLPDTIKVDGNIQSSVRSDKKPSEMKVEDYQYAQHYDKKSVKIINKRFKKDFKFYGYPLINQSLF